VFFRGVNEIGAATAASNTAFIFIILDAVWEAVRLVAELGRWLNNKE
jgi:hypothetical protein